MSSIDDVIKIEGQGPWQTKSGGQLNMLFQLKLDFILNHYLSYDESEAHKLPRDIRGLRAYSVRGIVKNHIGAGEWHKLRTELVFILNGAASWRCEDSSGKKKVIYLKQGVGVLTPPYILHTYKALEDEVWLLVIASTLFNADDKQTQDTYSKETFMQLNSTVLKSS